MHAATPEMLTPTEAWRWANTLVEEVRQAVAAGTAVVILKDDVPNPGGGWGGVKWGVLIGRPAVEWDAARLAAVVGAPVAAAGETRTPPAATSAGSGELGAAGDRAGAPPGEGGN